jgi:hypothetical protein
MRMFSVNAYAKIWEVKRVADKYTDLRISTSKKVEEGKYEQDFGGFVRLVGKAHQSAQYLNEGDSFKIIRCGVENHYDKEKKQTYTNFVIFEIEESEQNEKPATANENPFL